MIETSRAIRPAEEALNTGRGAPESTATAQEAKNKAPSTEPAPKHEKPMTLAIKLDRDTFKEIRFVKNSNPHERIRLPDKSVFVFPSQLYVCRDFEIASQIVQIADAHGIVVQ